MSVDKFIDEQGLKTVGVLVSGPKRQDGDERFSPLNFSPFVVYNRDLPGKSRLLFAVMRFISRIHYNIVKMMGLARSTARLTYYGP